MREWSGWCNFRIIRQHPEKLIFDPTSTKWRAVLSVGFGTGINEFLSDGEEPIPLIPGPAR